MTARRARARRGYAVAVLALLGYAAAIGASGPPPALPAFTGQGGYRLGDYFAEVPAAVPGATTIATARAHELFEAGGALFIDVLPETVKPANYPDDRIWLPRPRRNIPGSVWLPGIGHGALTPHQERYLGQALAQVVGGDLNRVLVVYCRADCWMSWNAAKRLAERGYRRVLWYPDGTDGWLLEGFDLAPGTPWRAPR